MLNRRYDLAVGTVANVLFCLLSLAVLNAQQLAASGARPGTLENFQVHSSGLENNKLGDPPISPLPFICRRATKPRLQGAIQPFICCTDSTATSARGPVMAIRI